MTRLERTDVASSRRRSDALSWRAWGALGVALAFVAACDTEESFRKEQETARAAPRAAPVLVVRHHVGGTHHACGVRDGVLYSTFSNSLLVMSLDKATVLSSIELAPFGSCGAASDLVLPEGSTRGFVLLDGTGVCEVSFSDPRAPALVALRHRAQIGFAPRALGWADDRLWISGDGGVVAWDDVAARPMTAATDEEQAGRRKAPAVMVPAARLAEAARERGRIGDVVATPQGLVAPAGRRLLRVSDGAYLGAATSLIALPAAESARLGLADGFAFGIQAKDGAQVGLMGGDLRELDATAVRGTLRTLRVANGMLFAINDDEIVALPLVPAGAPAEASASEGAPASSSPHLGAATYIAVKGARDLVAINDNYYLVVGSFGRALYRFAADPRGAGDTFLEARREPSRLTYATTDRRRILAGGAEGSWLYTIGDDVELVNRPLPVAEGRKLNVGGAWGGAAISDDRRSVRVRPAGGVNPDRATKDKGPEITWTPPIGGEVFGVESLDGRLWIWHADGVDILRVEQGGVHPDGSVQMEGPVLWFFPQRLGGAAAYVSEFGGFGVLDFIDREALPSIGGERILDLDGDGIDDISLTPEERAGAFRSFSSKPRDTGLDSALPSAVDRSETRTR